MFDFLSPSSPRDGDVRARTVVHHGGLLLLTGDVLRRVAKLGCLIAAEAGVVGDDHAGRAQVLRPPDLIAISISIFSMLLNQFVWYASIAATTDGTRKEEVNNAVRGEDRRGECGHAREVGRGEAHTRQREIEVAALAHQKIMFMTLAPTRKTAAI